VQAPQDGVDQGVLRPGKTSKMSTFLRNLPLHIRRVLPRSGCCRRDLAARDASVMIRLSSS